MTALHVAALQGRYWVVDVLLQYGATVTQACSHQWRLHYCDWTPSGSSSSTTSTHGNSSSKLGRKHSRGASQSVIERTGSTASATTASNSATDKQALQIQNCSILHTACMALMEPCPTTQDHINTSSPTTTTSTDALQVIELLLIWGSLPNAVAQCVSGTSGETTGRSAGATSSTGQTAVSCTPLELLIQLAPKLPASDSSVQYMSELAHLGTQKPTALALLMRYGARIHSSSSSSSGDVQTALASATCLASTAAVTACLTAYKSLPTLELKQGQAQILTAEAWKQPAASEVNAAAATATTAGGTTIGSNSANAEKGGSGQGCDLCSAEFTLLRRRHHCR